MSSSLLARSFAYIFKCILSNDIGQKFFGEEGSLPGFGRVTTKALTISVGEIEEAAAELSVLHSIGARMF